MQIFAQLGDGEDGAVGDLAAFGEDEVAEAGAGGDDFLDAFVA